MMNNYYKGKFWENYNRAKKGTKKGLNEAIAQDLDGLHQYYYLGTKEWEQSIYSLAKGWEIKIRDLDQVKCIRDEGKRYKEYMEESLPQLI